MMNSTSIFTNSGQDLAHPNPWLEIGRDYQHSLLVPHRIRVGDPSTPNQELSLSVSKCRQMRSMAILGEVSRTTRDRKMDLALYLAMREAQIAPLDRIHFPNEIASQYVETFALSGEPGQSCVLYLDFAMQKLFDELDESNRKEIVLTFPREIERTVEHHLQDFFDGAWALCVRKGMLTRGQYVRTLMNLHSYVRYTYPLLEECVALSKDERLLHHYVTHRDDEKNHEKIIERDLEYLSEDVEYLRNNHQPNVPTQTFISIQGSVIGFQQDPVLFLACPIAAEAFAAYTKTDMIVGLQESVEKWGLDNPDKATRFVRSHTVFDSGEDGHWGLCLNQLSEFITTESQMREFRSTLVAAMKAIQGIFDSVVLD